MSKNTNNTETIIRSANFFGKGNKLSTVVYLLNEGCCNANCEHCYVNTLKPEASSRNIETAYCHIKALQSSGYRVILRGTEILLNPEYLPLLKEVGQDYLQTNGIVIAKNPSIINKIAENNIKNIIITYPFSRDGIVDTSIDTAEKCIELCKEKFSITVSILITREFSHSIGLLDKACQKAIALGAKAIKFIRLMPINFKQLSITLNKEESQHVLREINTLKDKYPYDELVIQTPGCFGMFKFRRSLNKKKFGDTDFSDVYDCPAGLNHFVIDTNNNIFPCLYLMNSESIIGKYNNSALEVSENRVRIWGKLSVDDCPAFSFWTGQGA